MFVLCFTVSENLGESLQQPQETARDKCSYPPGYRWGN